jgi:hypothetical protein
VIDGLFAYLIGAVLIWRSDKQQRLGDTIAERVVVKALKEICEAVFGRRCTNFTLISGFEN